MTCGLPLEIMQLPLSVFLSLLPPSKSVLIPLSTGKKSIFYELSDFLCGNVIDIYGRYFLLVNADSFTIRSYATMGIQQVPVPMIVEEEEKVVQPIPVAGDGFLPIGSAEVSPLPPSPVSADSHELRIRWLLSMACPRLRRMCRRSIGILAGLFAARRICCQTIRWTRPGEYAAHVLVNVLSVAPAG